MTEQLGGRYITDNRGLNEYFSELLPEFVNRNKVKKQLASNSLNDTEIYESLSEQFGPIFFFIGDINDFFKNIYSPDEGVVDTHGFIENIMEKGALHNIYFFGCVDTEKAFDVSGYKAYSDFVGYKRGVHLGGAVSSQQIFTFQNIPFNETSKVLKKGIGLVPDSEDDTEAVRIVLPDAGK